MMSTVTGREPMKSGAITPHNEPMLGGGRRVWRSKQGPIALEDMSTSHISNALSALRRAGFVSPNEAHSSAGYPEPLGDIACHMLEMEDAFDYGDPLTTPWIDYFKAELKRRARIEAA